jgi:hypothetical protein
MDAETAETTTVSCERCARAATLIRRHRCASQYDSRKEMIMTLQAGDKLMSLADVSEMLGIPGRHVRYRREAVEAWLEQQADHR